MLDTMTVSNKATEPETPAIETRLTTAQVIVALSNMGKQIEAVSEIYKNLPDAKPGDVAELLKQIQNLCSGITANATRLLANNRGK